MKVTVVGAGAVGATCADNIARAALAYAIILQAATRAVEQLVRDTTAHAAKVSLDVSVIFAAITLGGGVTPSPYWPVRPRTAVNNL